MSGGNHDPFDTEGQRREAKEAQDALRLAKQVQAEDMAWLMGNKRGRRIVWRLLELAGVYRLSFNQSGSLMAFNEGMRNIGLLLQAEVAADADSYVLMLRENAKEPAK